MPQAAIGALLAAGTVTALTGAGIIAGVASFALFAKTFAITLAVGFLSSKLLSKELEGQTRGAAPTKHQSPAGQARWVLGRARVGGQLVWVREEGNTLHMAMVLSEGPCERIERVWVAGEEVPMVRNGFTLTPSRTAGRYQVYADRVVTGQQNEERSFLDKIYDHQKNVTSSEDVNLIEITEYFAADGNQGQKIRDAATDGLRWTAQHALSGKSYVYVKLYQPSYGDDIDRRIFSNIPQMEFLLKGLKIVPLGGTEYEWTENAAKLRAWWMMERRGIRPSEIDMTFYNAAVTKCDEIINFSVLPNYDPNNHLGSIPRYTINGVVWSGANIGTQESQFDFAWGGYAVYWDGQYYFRPGGERSAAATITQDNLVSEITVKPGKSSIINEVSAVVDQSAVHSYLPYSVVATDTPKVFEDKRTYSQTAGDLDYVIYPAQAQNLLTQQLYQFRRDRAVTLRIHPGASWEYANLMPGDKIELDLVDWSIDEDYMIVSSTLEDASVLVLQCVEWGAGRYDDALRLEAIIPRRALTPAGTPAPTSVNSYWDSTISLDKTIRWKLTIEWAPSPYKTQVRVGDQVQLVTGQSAVFYIDNPDDTVATVRHFNEKNGRFSTAVTTTVDFSTYRATLFPPDPVIVDFTIRGSILRLAVEAYRGERNLDGFDLRYAYAPLGSSETLTALTIETWDTAKRADVSSVVPSSNGFTPTVALFSIDESGRYRFFVRSINTMGLLSSVIEIGSFSIEISDIKNNVFFGWPDWAGVTTDMETMIFDTKSLLYMDRPTIRLARNIWDGESEDGWVVGHTGNSWYGTPDIDFERLRDVRVEITYSMYSPSDSTPRNRVILPRFFKTTDVGGIISDEVFPEVLEARSWMDIASMAAVLNHRIDGLVVSRLYVVQVRAIIGGVPTPPTATIPFSPAPQVPGVPADFSAISRSADSLGFSWTASNPPASSYRVYYGTTSTIDREGDAIDVDASLTATTIRGLDHSTEYHVAIEAHSGELVSDLSAVVRSSTYSVPNQPGPATLTSKTTSTLTIAWTAPSGGDPVDSYTVYYGPGPTINSASNAIRNITSLTTTLSGLDPTTTVAFRVAAVNGAGESQLSQKSTFITATFTDPPDAPTGLTVNTASVSHDNVPLTWTPAATGGGVGTYKIYYSTDSTVTTTDPHVTVDGSLTSGVVLNLDPLTRYWFAVIASNTLGDSGFSNKVSATTLIAPPGSPRTLSANTPIHDTVTLSWLAPSDGGAVSDYHVYASTDGENGVYSALGSAVSGLTVTFDDLTPSTRYWFRVFANNSRGFGLPSNTINITTTAAPADPGAPRSFSVSNVTSSSVNVAWLAPNTGDPVSEYRVYIGTSFGSIATLYRTVNASTLSITVSGLLSSTRYWLQVEARNDGGISPRSNTGSITTNAAPQAPNAPTSLTAADTTHNGVTLSWTPGGGAAEYYVYYSTDSTVNASDMRRISTETSYTFEDLDASTQYWFSVIASNTIGDSGFSNVVTITTDAAPTVPGTPGTPTLTTNSGSSVNLSWTAPTDGDPATSYKIYYSTDATVNSEDPSVTVEGVLTGSVSGLTPNTAYWFAIEAINDIGASASFSGVLSITTSNQAAPGAPTMLMGSAQGRRGIRLTWVAPTTGGDVASWLIQYRKTGTQNTFSEAAISDPATLTIDVSGLDIGTQYDFICYAINAIGTSLASNTARVTTSTDIFSSGTGTWSDPYIAHDITDFEDGLNILRFLRNTTENISTDSSGGTTNILNACFVIGFSISGYNPIDIRLSFTQAEHDMDIRAYSYDDDGYASGGTYVTNSASETSSSTETISFDNGLLADYMQIAISPYNGWSGSVVGLTSPIELQITRTRPQSGEGGQRQGRLAAPTNFMIQSDSDSVTVRATAPGVVDSWQYRIAEIRRDESLVFRANKIGSGYASIEFRDVEDLALERFSVDVGYLE